MGELVSLSSQEDGRKPSAPTPNHSPPLAQIPKLHLCFSHPLAQRPRFLGLVPSTFLVLLG
ncbi:hypothetical protein Hanom_Chr09g00818481 [Helianthus anomalus]